MTNEWQNRTDQELIEEAQTGVRGQGATIEMLRRVFVAAQQKTTRRLTWAIGVCTFLLLFAAGIQIYLQRLAMVGSTQTGDAWVLWTEQVATRWDPVGAWGTKAECEAEKTHYMNTTKNRFLSQGGEVIICNKGNATDNDLLRACVHGKEDSMVISYTGSAWFFNYVCLPESIDPRGPGHRG